MSQTVLLDLTSRRRTIVVVDEGTSDVVQRFRATDLIRALIEVRNLSSPNQEIKDYDDRLRQIHEVVDPLVHNVDI
jgi:hypothetical protein